MEKLCAEFWETCQFLAPVDSKQGTSEGFDATDLVILLKSDLNPWSCWFCDPCDLKIWEMTSEKITNLFHVPKSSVCHVMWCDVAIEYPGSYFGVVKLCSHRGSTRTNIDKHVGLQKWEKITNISRYMCKSHEYKTAPSPGHNVFICPSQW